MTLKRVTGKSLKKTDRDSRYASTLGKGLEVLRVFSPKDSILGNREISRRTGMPSATVSRLTYTLAQHGFLVQLHPSEAFQLGPAAIAIGYTAREGYSIFQTADPIMQELSDKVSMLVAACVRDGDAVVLARAWRPQNSSSIYLNEGHRLPVTRSAPGRAILASQTQQEPEAENWASDRRTLEAKGFVSSLGGWNAQVNACAVPFTPNQGGMAFAFLCGAPDEELNEQRLDSEVGPALVAHVDLLKRSMGLV